MRLRMYVTLPDLASARQLANDLLLARIEDRHMHFLARRGTDLGELHEASTCRRPTPMHGAFTGLVMGGVVGVIVGLLLVYFPPGGMSVQLVAVLIAALVGAVLGIWIASMMGLQVPNTQLKGFEQRDRGGQDPPHARCPRRALRRGPADHRAHASRGDRPRQRADGSGLPLGPGRYATRAGRDVRALFPFPFRLPLPWPSCCANPTSSSSSPCRWPSSSSSACTASTPPARRSTCRASARACPRRRCTSCRARCPRRASSATRPTPRAARACASSSTPSTRSAATSTCIVEADRLGMMRTGAAGGVAAKWLARPDAKVVGVFGSGWQAAGPDRGARRGAQARAREGLVAQRREAREVLRAHGDEARRSTWCPRPRPTTRCSGSDIVVTITTSATPVFYGRAGGARHAHQRRRLQLAAAPGDRRDDGAQVRSRSSSTRAPPR